jgi:hypothetical protein
MRFDYRNGHSSALYLPEACAFKAGITDAGNLTFDEIGVSDLRVFYLDIGAVPSAF